MASTGTDRVEGLDPSTAIKAPCVVATTANITLSGAQTIDGVAVAETSNPSTRVLVRAQTDTTENGIWDVKGTAWTRSEDFDGNRDVVSDTLVNVDQGSSYSNTTWRVVATNPVVIGTSAIAFSITQTLGTSITINHATVAAMVADASLASGDRVKTDEAVATYGYEGGNTYLVGAAGSFGTADGWSIVDLTGSSLQALALFPYGANCMQFGVGTGSGTDFNTELQAWLDYLSDQDEALFPPGNTYRTDQGLTVSAKALNFVGYGATLDISNNTDTLEEAIGMTGTGLTATTTTASANIAEGADTITVVSESGFSAGDYIQIQSSAELLGGTATYLKGELARIRSTASTTLNIEGKTNDSYLTASGTITITLLSMIDRPSIKGLKILGDGTSATRHIGVRTSYAIAPLYEHVTVVDCASTGLDFTASLKGLMEGCYVDNCNATTPVTEGYAYSMSPFAQNCIISDCRAIRFRHAFTTGGLLPVWNWKIIGCDFSDQLAGISAPMVFTHSNGANGQFINTTMDGGYGGIHFGGPRNKISGNTIKGISTVEAISLIDDGPHLSSITNNETYSPIAIGVSSYTTADSTVTVAGNECYGVAVGGATKGYGITVDSDRAVIKNNTIREHSGGIRIAGADTVVKGNDIYDTDNDASPYGIRAITGADGARISDNTIQCETSTTMTNGILLDSGLTGIIVRHNDIDDAVGAPIQDNATGTQSYANSIDGIVEGLRISTTAALADIADVVNTTNKRRDELILNSDTEDVIRASSNTAGAVWVDMTGATQHTPV